MSELRLFICPSHKYKTIILLKKKDTEDHHWEVETKGATLESAWTLSSNRVAGSSSYSKNGFLYRFFFRTA